MAEDTIDQAIEVAQLEYKPSLTENFPLHGYIKNKVADPHLAHYGSDADEVRSFMFSEILKRKTSSKI